MTRGARANGATGWGDRVLGLLVLLALITGVPVPAAEHYVVGVENIDYRPYQAGHTGVFEGFGRELLDAFAAEAGIVFEYRPLPPPRLLASLLQDRVDLALPGGHLVEKAAGRLVRAVLRRAFAERHRVVREGLCGHGPGGGFHV